MTRISGPASRVWALVAGPAAGPALVLSEPLSFWGGVDPSDGRIIDQHHPQAGETVRGKVLVMPSGRGSSSSSSVLAETIRAGTSPVAIVLAAPDRILALGAVVAAELYGDVMPVVALGEDAYRSIRDGAQVEILGADEVWEIIVEGARGRA
jgi:predicted aconitase with swiveling domain